MAKHLHVTSHAGGVAKFWGSGYVPFEGLLDNINAEQSYASNPVQDTHTWANLFARILANARLTTSTFRSRVNQANGNMSATIAATTTGTIEDTSNTDSLVAADEINWLISLASGGTETLTVSVIASTLEDTDGDVGRVQMAGARLRR